MLNSHMGLVATVLNSIDREHSPSSEDVLLEHGITSRTGPPNPTQTGMGIVHISFIGMINIDFPTIISFFHQLFYITYRVPDLYKTFY